MESRKLFTKNDNLNSLCKIGFIGKGRMNPLGAITAISDIINLDNRNKILKKQTKIMEDAQKPDSDESSNDDTATLPSKVQFPAPKVSISGSKILILILVLIVFFIIFNYLQ